MLQSSNSIKHFFELLIVLFIFSTKILGQVVTDISVKKVFTIEGDQKNFLGHPVDLVSTNDLVFIADMMDMKIKVFTLKGKYVRSFGSRGRGPQEFQHLTKIWLDKNNNIAIADFFNSRISIFTQKGKLVKETPFNSGEIIWPRYFENVGENVTLVAYSPPQDPYKVFHIWVNDFKELKNEHYLPAIEEIDPEFLELVIQLRIGSIKVLDNKIFYAPFFYGGYLYSKDLNISDSEWEISQGLLPGTEIYELMSKSAVKINKDNENIYDYSISSSGGRFTYRLYSGTKQLFSTKDGKIAHLFELVVEGQKKQGVQLFSKSGVYLGHTYYNTKQLRDDQYTLINDHPMTMDDKNRFYSIDYRYDSPKINVYQLSYDN